MNRASRSLIEGVDYHSFGASVLDTLSAEPKNDCIHCLEETQSAGLQGKQFLEAVMRLIWTVLEPKLLFLGVCSGDGKTVKTVITYQDGKRCKDFDFAIAHTPCSDVLGPQSLCIYPSDSAALFPRAERLQMLKAEGYAGMPLFSRDGTRIGVLTAITDHPIENLEEVRGVFTVFGARLSLELERLLADRAHRQEVMHAVKREEQMLLEAARTSASTH